MWGLKTGTRCPCTQDDVQRLIAERIPESGSLEYKERLELETDAQKRELLKDLTGMGNGGGGTIIYGVMETDDRSGHPAQLAPLTDPALPGRLEDVVRNAVRPPLIMDLQWVEVDTGYVLVVNVFRSPLGPYMVQAYGENRYYLRQGSRVAPMDEQQVRDAYLLAVRQIQDLERAWTTRELPILPPTDRPYLTVSAIPLGPSTELIPPGRIDPDVFRPPDWMGGLRTLGQFRTVTRDLHIWYRGIYGEAPYPITDLGAGWQIFRLDRDGAVGLAYAWSHADRSFSETFLARVAAAQLVYIGWLWQQLGLRDLVEVDIRLQNPSQFRLYVNQFEKPLQLQVASGTSPPLALVHRAQILSSDLARASTRHRLVWEFSAKVCHAYGKPGSSSWCFTEGLLYRSDGHPSDLVAVGGGIQQRSGLQDLEFRIYRDGRVERVGDGRYVGHFSKGVLLDVEGDAVAATELALDTALPDDFLVKHPVNLDRPSARLTEAPDQVLEGYRPPGPTGRWSRKTLEELHGTR
jgi:hypothetical protein